MTPNLAPADGSSPGRPACAWLAIAILSGSLSAGAAAPDPFASATANVRVYFDTDGLPQNSVESLSLDPDARLWVATRDGGAVFDGTAWTTIPMPDPLGSNWPRKVLAGSDGSVWFGVEPGGLHRLRDGDWQSWNEINGVPGRVHPMVDHDGTLFVGTTKGLHAIPLSSTTPSTELAERDVAALSRSGSEVFAVLSDGTILRRADGTWIPDPRRGVSGGGRRACSSPGTAWRSRPARR